MEGNINSITGKGIQIQCVLSPGSQVAGKGSQIICERSNIIISSRNQYSIGIGIRS